MFKPSKATKNARFSWKDYGVYVLEYISYLKKRKTLIVDLLERLKAEIATKRLQIKKKKLFSHYDNALCHKLFVTTAHLHELGFELSFHPPYSPDLVRSDYRFQKDAP